MVVLVTSTIYWGPVATWVSGGTEPKLLANPTPSKPLAMPTLSVAGDLGASTPGGASFVRISPACLSRESFPSLCNFGCKPRGTIIRPSGSSDWDFTAGANKLARPY